jgi:hypothetical protein
MEWFNEPMTDRLRGVQAIFGAILLLVSRMMDKLRKISGIILLSGRHLAPNDLGSNSDNETVVSNKHSSYVEYT